MGKNNLFNSLQLSLFDNFIEDLKKDGVSVSSSDITKLIKMLTSARDDVKRREDKERSLREKEEAKRKAEEYLSGNLMRKWNAAQKANVEYKGYFEDNINALSKILPTTIATKDIYIKVARIKV